MSSQITGKKLGSVHRTGTCGWDCVMNRVFVISAMICFTLTIGNTAFAQESLSLAPGMTYGSVKAFVNTNPDLVYQSFDANSLVISTTSRRFIPMFSANIVFCQSSNYDGRAITVITMERFHSKDATEMVQRFHDLFQRMSGDQFDKVISTRTEGDEARKNGTLGVSIKHHLKNGETWDLGIFNRQEVDEHIVQLVRTVSPETECKSD